MARPTTINKERILDIAEGIVNTSGAVNLTFDAIAKAAGISKGGMQSCFGNKQNLINEMLQRSIGSYETAVEQLVGDSKSIYDRVRAHLTLTFSEVEDSQRAAALMAAIFQYPQSMDIIQKWYRAMIEEIYQAPLMSQNLRIALMAIEGAFFLRFFGLVPVSNEQWQTMYSDILSLLESSALID